MLILTRKIGEGIIIGDGVRVVVLELRGKQIRLGIEAPMGVVVLRDEIFQRLLQENREAATFVFSDLQALQQLVGPDFPAAGPLPPSAIPAALRAMDACVVPHSNAYRSPIKLFEYMAQERAVLAPRTEPIESVLREGIDALLFTPLDVRSFRESLQKLLDSKEFRESMGHNARRLIEEGHTWEKNAREILAGVN